MGQYFFIINLNKKEFIDPSTIKHSLKFNAIVDSNLPNLLVYLLHESTSKDEHLGENAGRWAGDRITIAGDFDKSNNNHYYNAEKEFKDISIEMRDEYNTYINSFTQGTKEKLIPEQQFGAK